MKSNRGNYSLFSLHYQKDNKWITEWNRYIKRYGETQLKSKSGFELEINSIDIC